MAGAGGIRAGRAFVEIGGENSGLFAALNGARDGLTNLGRSVFFISEGFARIGAAIATPLRQSVGLFARIGDELLDMSIRTGVSVEALSQLRYAATLSGTSIEALETGIKIMSRTLGEAAGGSKEATDTLDMLGVSIAQLNSLSQEGRFLLLSDRISAIRDPALRATAALRLFGRSGTQLLPLLNDGARGMRNAMREADDFGLTIRTLSAVTASELDDAFTRIKAVAENLGVTIGEKLAPVLTDLSNIFARLTGLVEDAIQTGSWSQLSATIAAGMNLLNLSVASGMEQIKASFGLSDVVTDWQAMLVLLEQKATRAMIRIKDTVWDKGPAGTVIEASGVTDPIKDVGEPIFASDGTTIIGFQPPQSSRIGPPVDAVLAQESRDTELKLKEIEEGRNKRVREAGEAAAKAAANFQILIEQLKAGWIGPFDYEAMKNMRPGFVGPPAPTGLTKSLVSQARDMDRFVAAGTFGGAAARGLLGPGSALGAVEKNTKATVDELRNVRRAVEDQEGPAVG